MRRQFRSSLVLLASVALCLLAACSLMNTSGPASVGQPVPAFSLNDLDGKPFNIADYKGKVVLINVFATW